MDKFTVCLVCPALLALSAAAAVSGCSSGKDKDMTREPVPVRVIEIKEQAGTGGLSCSYAGTLRDLRVSEGDAVRKGDTIAVIESQNVISAKQMADAVLAQAEDGYERLSMVYESGSVAQVKMVEVQTQLSRARASAQAAQKALDDCTVKAPFDGVVGEVYAEQGVEMNAIEPLVRMMDISSVQISFPVPEKEIGSVSTGDMFMVGVPALDGPGFTASVKSKGISASRLSHSYECMLIPSVNVAGLMPGMVCKIYRMAEEGRCVVIPASVVRTDGTGRYVWTVSPDSRVEKKYITVGGFSGKGIIVDSGLEEGEKVITEGTQKVSGGMKVKIM